MKKSQAIKYAESAVLNCEYLEDQEKLDVLKVLFKEEDNALYWEEKEKENG